MKIAQTILAIVLGAALSAALIGPIAEVLANLIVESGAAVPDGFIGLFLVGIPPFGLFLGSVASGLLLPERLNIESPFRVISCSPGIYLAAGVLVYLVVGKGTEVQSSLFIWGIVSPFAVVFSAGGAILGSVLQHRKSNQAL